MVKNNSKCHEGRRKLIGFETVDEKQAKIRAEKKLKEMELKKNAKKQN